MKRIFIIHAGAETILLHERGHIGGDDHATEVPEVLEATLKLTGQL